MDFPYEAKYLLDWSPASGWSYADFLQEKKFDPTLWFAIRQEHLDMIGTAAQLEKRGFLLNASEPHEGYGILTRNIAGIEQSVRLGTSEISSALRWNFLVPSIGIERINDTPKQLNETLRNVTMGWAYEQFVAARNEYNRGHYSAALDLLDDAINGNGIRSGYGSEFRFHYLLGRTRIGGWFGDYKNAETGTVDPLKAEMAFLEAVRYRKHATDGSVQDDVSADADMAQILVWAGRAAYFQGVTDRAITHIRNALTLLTPANRSLYAAAQYQHAKFLCTRAKGDDVKTAETILTELIPADILLAVEVASEPQFTVLPEFVDTVLGATQNDLRGKYTKRAGEFDTLLQRIDGFVHDGTMAEDLLRDEVGALRKVREEYQQEAAGGGLLDFDSATKLAGDALPKPGFLFGLFKTRFNKDRLQRWENSKVTRAAKDAGSFLKWCEEDYKQAEDVYRKNGGFARDGGADKFGYAIICTLLAVYMFIAQARWGGNAVIAAVVFLAIALWLFLSFLRIKLGLVEGYEKYRAAKSALAAAQSDVTQKDDASAKAWMAFQKTIDALTAFNAPF